MGSNRRSLRRLPSKPRRWLTKNRFYHRVLVFLTDPPSHCEASRAAFGNLRRGSREAARRGAPPHRSEPSYRDERARFRLQVPAEGCHPFLGSCRVALRVVYLQTLRLRQRRARSRLPDRYPEHKLRYFHPGEFHLRPCSSTFQLTTVRCSGH